MAVLNGNIQYTNLETKMLADEMQIDLISRTSKIYMLDKNKKIKVINSKKMALIKKFRIKSFKKQKPLASLNRTSYLIKDKFLII